MSTKEITFRVLFDPDYSTACVVKISCDECSRFDPSCNNLVPSKMDAGVSENSGGSRAEPGGPEHGRGEWVEPGAAEHGDGIEGNEQPATTSTELFAQDRGGPQGLARLITGAPWASIVCTAHSNTSRTPRTLCTRCTLHTPAIGHLFGHVAVLCRG